MASWDVFYAGRPSHPPVVLGMATQFFIFNENLNPAEEVTFERTSLDAGVMLDLRVDLQNFDEAAYFGAPVTFIPHQVPDTLPILAAGVLEGGPFFLREGNNLAPHTPFENLEAMCQTARRVG